MSNIYNGEILPDIPKEWNLNDQQRTDMINAQKKTIDNKKSDEINQTQYLTEFDSKSKLIPPQYPIIVIFKDNNASSVEKDFYKDNKNYARLDFLKSNDGNYIYATSFDNASTLVLNEIKSLSNNSLKTITKNSSKLRISGDNLKLPLQEGHFPYVPNSSYLYWQIIVTNAPLSMVSSFKNLFKSKGGKKTNKSKKSIKVNKLKKSKKQKKSKKTKK